jgi:hypothetical protein
MVVEICIKYPGGRTRIKGAGIGVVFFINSQPRVCSPGSRPGPPTKVARCHMGGPGAPLKHR